MAGPCVLNDTSDLEELSKPQGLFLKPIARLNISVQLPHLTEPGKTISNWEVMEKMKGMAKPDKFTMIKVAKSTMDFVRFEAEVESKSILKNVLTRVDGGTIKLSGFTEILKVKAAEAKLPFPVRHDWDSFFRDSKEMNEMVPGERPDTIHLELLPCKWFYDQRFNNANRPSPHVLQKVFESFGEIRCVDIPVLDPYRRNSMKEAKSFSTFDAHLTFEAYIQYVEYISFVKAMDALRGMKLVFREKPQLIIPSKKPKENEQEDGEEKKAETKGGEEGEEEKGEDWKAALDLNDQEKKESDKDGAKEEASLSEPRSWMADIKVDFDKSKHLTDEKIQKRKARMEKFIKDQKDKVEKEQRRIDDIARRREEEALNKEQAHLRQIHEKEAKRREREEKRRKKRHEQKIAIKIATEERKILIASRKLETIRLLEELFNRIRLVKHQEEVEQRMLKLEEMKKKELDNAAERQLKEEARKLRREEKRRQKLLQMEEVFKKRLVLKMKAQQEKQKEINREKARLEIQVKGSKLSSTATIASVAAPVPRRVSSHGVLAREKLYEERDSVKEKSRGESSRGGFEGERDYHARERPRGGNGYNEERPRGGNGYHEERPRGGDGHFEERPRGEDGYYENQRRKRKAYEDEQDVPSQTKKERHQRRKDENDDDDDDGEDRRSGSRGKSGEARSSSRTKVDDRSESRSKSRGKSQNPRDSSRSEDDEDDEDDEKRDSDKEDRDDDVDQDLINKITTDLGGQTAQIRGKGKFQQQNRGRGRNVFGKFDPNYLPNMRGRGRGFFRPRGRGRGFYPRKDFAGRDDAFMRKYYRVPAQEDDKSPSEDSEDESDSDDDDDSDKERKSRNDDDGEDKPSRRHRKKKRRDDDDDEESYDEVDEATKSRRRPHKAKLPKKLPLVPLDRPIPVPQQLYYRDYRGMGRPRGYYEFPPDRRQFYNRGGFHHGGEYEGGRPPMPLYRRRNEYDEADHRYDDGEYGDRQRDHGDRGRDYGDRDNGEDEEPRRREEEEPRRRVEREHSSSKHKKKHKKHKKRKSKESSDEEEDENSDNHRSDADNDSD